MTLVQEFRDMVAKRERQLADVRQRVQEATDAIEQLLARNVDDGITEAQLLHDIEVLNTEIARLSEHDEPVEQPRMSDEEIARVVKGDKSPTRAEVERMARERHEAEQEATKPRRRQKSKPDPVKAAKKAAKREAATKKKAPASQGTQYRSLAQDPLHVNTKREGSGVGRTLPKGMKKTRLRDIRPEDIDISKFTPTDMVRADLLYEMLRENAGYMDQTAMAKAWGDLIGAKPHTAQAHVSKLLRVLVSQRRVVFVGMVQGPDGRASIMSWKTVEVATPPKRAAAGLSLDDDYAGTTTRWPTTRLPAGARITVEPSQFEQGKR